MAMNKKVLDAIQKAAEINSTECFVESHIRPDNLHERLLEGLGIAISQWSARNGLIILKVFAAALDDANYHDEAAQVQDMIEKVEGM